MSDSTAPRNISAHDASRHVHRGVGMITSATPGSHARVMKVTSPGLVIATAGGPTSIATIDGMRFVVTSPADAGCSWSAGAACATAAR
ncbi:hypothetical protein BJY24_003609 [Nocardia transvalensis]|uniref:Uncharacterized protein n=1 Tax=Nocardia transvalensis TaxID=37333 RepID=A0A7W9PES6_9NOCA|nr:hypothetical protein [Nocardia transvalensis]MBB5914742.1 hypothetical protein [Nocardia transvalensis]